MSITHYWSTWIRDTIKITHPTMEIMRVQSIRGYPFLFKKFFGLQ